MVKAILLFCLFSITGCSFFFKINQNKTALKISSDTMNLTIPLNDTIFENESSSDRVLYFYQQDSIGREIKILVDSTKSFVPPISGFLFEPSFFNMPYYVSANDSIFVETQADYTTKLVIPNQANKTLEANFFTTLFNETGRLTFIEYAILANENRSEQFFQTLLIRIDSIKQKRLNILNEYTNKKISTSFIDIAKNSIALFALEDSLLLYHYFKGKTITESSYQLFLKDVFKQLEQNFTHYIHAYQGRVFDILVNVTANLNPFSTVGFKNDFIQRFDCIVNNANGYLKTYLLYKLIVNGINEIFEVPLTYQQAFFNQSSNENMNSEVAELLDNKTTLLKLRGNNFLLSSDMKTIQTLEKIIKKYRGNTIYVDFWSSWCIPCRKEMIASKQLQSTYKDKPIIFLFISIENDKYAWKQASSIEKIANEYNYLFLNSQEASFIKKAALNYIPRYMLFDEKGKLIDADAPAPSNPKLVLQLNSLMIK